MAATPGKRKGRIAMDRKIRFWKENRIGIGGGECEEGDLSRKKRAALVDRIRFRRSAGKVLACLHDCPPKKGKIVLFRVYSLKNKKTPGAAGVNI